MVFEALFDPDETEKAFSEGGAGAELVFSETGGAGEGRAFLRTVKGNLYLRKATVRIYKGAAGEGAVDERGLSGSVKERN